MTTADVSGPYAGASPSKHTGIRVAVGILGLAAVVVGVVLLFHPVAAARTLALLVGLALVVARLGAHQSGVARRVSPCVSGAARLEPILGAPVRSAWPNPSSGGARRGGRVPAR